MSCLSAATRSLTRRFDPWRKRSIAQSGAPYPRRSLPASWANRSRTRASASRSYRRQPLSIVRSM
jgi:hypothetical protein